MIRFDRPAFRSSFLVGVLALLSIVLALPGSAASGRDGRADDGVPAEPTGLRVGVQPGALEVGVSWDDVPGATSYSLSWRRPGGGFQPRDAVIATDTEATLAVPDHGLWRLRLQACNDAGCGPGRAREVALVQEPIVTGASDPATGSTLTLTGACADVTVTVLASEAEYTSMFLHFDMSDMSDMSMATDLMITNRQVGSTMVLRGLSAGELVLGIRVQETGDVFRTGPASRNPDGLIHARISGSTVSFEDYSGGGDEDFNDAVLLVTRASCGGSPPPPPPGNTQPDNSGNTPPDSNDGDPPPDSNDGDPPPDSNDGDPPPDSNDGDPPPDSDDGDPPPDSDDGDPPPDSNDGDPPPDSNDGDPPPDSNDGDPPPDSDDGDPPPDSDDGDPPPDSDDGDPPPDSNEGTPPQEDEGERADTDSCGSSVLPVPPPGGWSYGVSDTSDLAALIAAQRFPVASVWVFDVPTQEFLGHVVGAPEFVNTLDDSSLSPGRVVIMQRSDAPGGVPDEAAPVAADEPKRDAPTVLPVPPPGGWTYGLACTSDLAALIAAQRFPVVSVWVFDAAAQNFLGHGVGQPEFLNTLDASSLTPGSVVIMRRTGVVPIAPPHQFYGSAAAGSGAAIDGELVPDGTVITARNEDGKAVGRTAVTAGDWVIYVYRADAASVTFSITGSVRSRPYDVVIAARTEVALDLAALDAGGGDGDAAAGDDGDAAARGPELLPNTGSGGIAGSGGLAGGRGLLALAVALAVSVALAGMAVVRRTRA